ncbi:hypothetical protein N864_15025 [Intrasporangium chromatireducens Q5-1]|uniref:Uncharacterized protein n=1 Tax=Intrasporangium chromatireducens Q5-1 TaxID=584657 RepID=W9GDG7_9MICO|nr:hypothetical protein [Intrasporangium chromatireducens]EWT04251.1 hypothetical protein N864_15025 [Intrasporangium chromatireducens Q5-1]
MSTTTPKKVRDLRGGWRRALAVLVPVPAALVAAEFALTPYGLFASPTEQLAAASAAPGRVALVTWLVLAGLLLGIPAAMAAAWAVRRSAPRLALAGGILTVVGFALSITVPSSELLAAAAVQRGTDSATFERVATAVAGHPAVGTTTIAFLAAQAIGLLLLGLALWRTPSAPRWLGAVLASSGLLHVALSASSVTAAASWALTAVGLVGVSVVLLRQSDDEFDLPPTGVVHAATDPRPRHAPGDPRDVRRTWQWLLALSAPVMAAGIAVLRFTLPFNTLDTPDEAFSKLVANPTFTSAQVWFGFLTPVVISGVLAVLWVTRRRVPVLATVAGVLCVLGYTALAAADSVSPVLADVVAHGGLDTASVRPIAAALEAMPQPTTAVTVFVIGHLAGTVLLGIALWRSRVLPAWVGIALAVSQPVHLVSAMTGNHPLDLAAWGATALCMGLAGAAVLRMSPDEFDLPPAPAQPLAAPAVTADLPAPG